MLKERTYNILHNNTQVLCVGVAVHPNGQVGGLVMTKNYIRYFLEDKATIMKQRDKVLYVNLQIDLDGNISRLDGDINDLPQYPMLWFPKGYGYIDISDVRYAQYYNKSAKNQYMLIARVENRGIVLVLNHATLRLETHKVSDLGAVHKMTNTVITNGSFMTTKNGGTTIRATMPKWVDIIDKIEVTVSLSAQGKLYITYEDLNMYSSDSLEKKQSWLNDYKNRGSLIGDRIGDFSENDIYFDMDKVTYTKYGIIIPIDVTIETYYDTVNINDWKERGYFLLHTRNYGAMEMDFNTVALCYMFLQF